MGRIDGRLYRQDPESGGVVAYSLYDDNRNYIKNEEGKPEEVAYFPRVTEFIQFKDEDGIVRSGPDHEGVRKARSDELL